MAYKYKGTKKLFYDWIKKNLGVKPITEFLKEYANKDNMPCTQTLYKWLHER